MIKISDKHLKKSAFFNLIDILKNAFLSFLKLLKPALLFVAGINTKIKIAVLAVVVIAVTIPALYFSGVRISYEVLANDKTVFELDDKEVFEKAKDLAKEKIVTSGDEPLFTEFEVKTVISKNMKPAKYEEICNYLLTNAKGVSRAFAVCVNGETKLYVADKTVAETAVSDRLNFYNVEGATCENTLGAEISYGDVYCESGMLADEQAIRNLLAEVSVTTVATKTSQYETAYKTITNETNTQYVGYSAVTTRGVTGVNRVTEVTTYVNGVATTPPTVTDTCVTQKVDKVITKGTKSVPQSTSKPSANKSGFLFPVNVPWRISAYWGDGRGHKAIDIAKAPGTSIVGAPILACKDGVVTISRYYGDYGNLVEIDHGDGSVTRYAHCKDLLVKQGAVVKQGQQIATVGSTGRVTGPHLHLEIRINGKPVNPAPYFGL